MKAATAKPAPSKATAMSDDQFRAISKALADPRRYDILQQIAVIENGIACGDLQVEISPATVSHHLKELYEAGLIETERDGRCANLRLQRKVWKAYLQRLAAL